MAEEQLVKVRQGWSGEIRPNIWAKVSVEVDDGDLHRMLAVAGLLERVEALSVAEAFQLLDAESELLLLAKLMTRYGQNDQAAKDRIVELSQVKSRLLARLREQPTVSAG